MATLADVVFYPAQVAALAPTLSGAIYLIQFWYQGLAAWVDLDPNAPPVVPLNTALSLVICWRNTSSVSVRGRVDLTITKPDGTPVTPLATVNQNLVAAPNNGWCVMFEAVVLDKPGQYQGRVILSGEQA